MIFVSIQHCSCCSVWHVQGKLFSVDLLDKDGGQIKATMFTEAADKFFPVLQLNKVFTITKGNLKIANKRWSNLPNEYELNLNTDAIVEEVAEDDSEIEEQK